MKKLINVTLTILTIVFGLGLTSCNEEEPYVDIITVTSYSPDLLQFVMPTVKITGMNGDTQSFILSLSDFIKSDKGDQFK